MLRFCGKENVILSYRIIKDQYMMISGETLVMIFLPIITMQTTGSLNNVLYGVN